MVVETHEESTGLLVLGLDEHFQGNAVVFVIEQENRAFNKRAGLFSQLLFGTPGNGSAPLGFEIGANFEEDLAWVGKLQRQLREREFEVRLGPVFMKSVFHYKLITYCCAKSPEREIAQAL